MVSVSRWRGNWGWRGWGLGFQQYRDRTDGVSRTEAVTVRWGEAPEERQCSCQKVRSGDR